MCGFYFADVGADVDSIAAAAEKGEVRLSGTRAYKRIERAGGSSLRPCSSGISIVEPMTGSLEI